MIRFRPFHFAAIILGLLSLAAPSEAGAQYTSAPLRFEKDPTQTFFSNGHLELGLDVGTTGLGLELATPATVGLLAAVSTGCQPSRFRCRST